MSSFIDRLKYDDESNGFKWYGTKEELKSLVNFTLEVDEEEQDGEWTEDKSHSSMTFKQQGCYSRFYTTTKKLIIQGPDHARLRDNFLAMLKSPQEASKSNQATQSNNSASSPTNLTLEDLWNELSAVKQEVVQIKERIADSENGKLIDFETRKQKQDLVEENKRLLQELKESKNANLELTKTWGGSRIL